MIKKQHYLIYKIYFDKRPSLPSLLSRLKKSCLYIGEIWKMNELKQEEWLETLMSILSQLIVEFYLKEKES